MVALTASHHLNRSPNLIAAIVVGLAAAVAAALLPAWRIEALVIESGLPALLPAAAPPLGWTARIAIVVAAAAAAGGITFAVGERLAPVRRIVRSAVRRADVHPDAPLREPMKAMRDLGTPFLEAGAPVEGVAVPPAERELPSDLDLPLAAFDPHAIPETPMTPSVSVTPLFRPLPEPVAEDDEPPVVEHVRIETFALPTPVPIATSASEANVHALLDRLESGMRRRGGRPAITDRAIGAELDAALASLRRFAAAR